ncbi:MAG: hypothetical protein ACKOXB_01960 [Flavobacteriales bacterium]
MKKSLLLLLSLGIVVVSCKKKTTDDDKDNNTDNTPKACDMVITSAMGPKIGDLFTFGVDKSFNDTNLFKKTGEDQTWDLASLSSTAEDTFKFKSGSTDPLASTIAGSMIISTQGLDLIAVQSVSGITINACQLPPIINNISATPSFTDPATFIPYPLEKNATYSDTYSASATMPYDTVIALLSITIDSVRATLKGSNTFTVDGCGKVTTPTGTYDCLKYKVTPGALTEKYEARANGTWMDFTVMIKALPGFKTPELPLINSKSYIWVSKDKKFPVCMVTLDASGNATSVQYLK